MNGRKNNGDRALPGSRIELMAHHRAVSRNNRRTRCRREPRVNFPTGITPKTRTKNGKTVPVMTEDGTPVYRVRVWDPALKKQVERVRRGPGRGQGAAGQFKEAKRRPGRLQAERVRFVDVAARYLVAYKTKRDGTPRPKSSLAKERTCLNVYIIPALGNAWIGDLDLPDLNETIRGLTLQDGTPASGSTKSTVASVHPPAVRLGARGAHHSRATPRWNCAPAGAVQSAAASSSRASRKCCAWPRRSTTSSRALAMSPWSSPSPGCAGRRPSRSRSRTSTSTASASRSTGPPASRADAGTSAPT